VKSPAVHPFRQPVSRRHVLRGAAAAVTLPFLESLAGRARAATCPTRAPRRLLVYHVPNGVHMARWMPKGTGVDYQLSPTLAGLAPVRQDVTVVTGVVNGVGAPITGPGGHATGYAGLLTCVQPRRSPTDLGKSVDQVAADAIGACTRLPSLNLGMDTKEGQAETFPLDFNRNMSWSGPTTPVPHIVDPLQAFNKLFTGVDPKASAADVARRAALRTSVLDTVSADAKRLAPRLGASDRTKLDEFTTAVRKVESQIQTAAPVTTCTVPAPPADAADFPTRLQHMHDVMVLAFQCDLTRVITFSLGNALSTRPYSFIGIGDGHSVTHHSGNPALIDQACQLDMWRLGQFVKLIQRLKAVQDSDGSSLLHNMVAYYTSEISDGNIHNQDNKPILLAGQLGGTIKTGRLLQTSAPTSGSVWITCNELNHRGCSGGVTQLANLYVAFLNGLGVPVSSFGNSTGALALG
jgi:hypothetical protein